MNGVQLLERTLRVDHKLEYNPPTKKKKEREKEGVDETIPKPHEPGHAYKDGNLKGPYDIHRGVDPFAAAPSSPQSPLASSQTSVQIERQPRGYPVDAAEEATSTEVARSRRKSRRASEDDRNRRPRRRHRGSRERSRSPRRRHRRKSRSQSRSRSRSLSRRRRRGSYRSRADKKDAYGADRSADQPRLRRDRTEAHTDVWDKAKPEERQVTAASSKEAVDAPSYRGAGASRGHGRGGHAGRLGPSAGTPTTSWRGNQDPRHRQRMLQLKAELIGGSK